MSATATIGDTVMMNSHCDGHFGIVIVIIHWGAPDQNISSLSTPAIASSSITNRLGTTTKSTIWLNSGEQISGA